ncbi:hypothetical protein T439DRAFT_356314 [Meredithblackwellia eburnea MCA 4105]
MSNVLALHHRGVRRPFTEHHLDHHTHRISQRRPSVPQDLTLSDEDVEKAQPLVMYPMLQVAKRDHHVGLVEHAETFRKYASLNIGFLRQLHKIQSSLSYPSHGLPTQAEIDFAAALAGQLSSLSRTIFHKPTDYDYIHFCEAQSQVIALLLSPECEFEEIGGGLILDLGLLEPHFDALWEICKTIIFETGPFSLKPHQLELQTMWDAVAGQCRGDPRPGVASGVFEVAAKMGIFRYLQPGMELTSWSAELYGFNEPSMGKLLILSRSAEKWCGELRCWDSTTFQQDFNLASFNEGQHVDLHQSYIRELHSFLYQMKLLGVVKAIPTRSMASEMFRLADLMGEQDEKIRQIGTLTVSLGTGIEPKIYKATTVLGMLQQFARVGANEQFRNFILAHAG